MRRFQRLDAIQAKPPRSKRKQYLQDSILKKASDFKKAEIIIVWHFQSLMSSCFILLASTAGNKFVDVLQMKRWIHSGRGFIGSFDLPWSKWSRITNPDPDHPKGVHPKYISIYWKDSRVHFWVPKTLTFKKRPSAQPALWKWVLFGWEWKIISISKAEHLTSFWYRGPGKLRNGLFKFSFNLLLRFLFERTTYNLKKS